MWRGGGWPCKRTCEHVWPLNQTQKEIQVIGKMTKYNKEIYTKIIPPWKQCSTHTGKSFDSFAKFCKQLTNRGTWGGLWNLVYRIEDILCNHTHACLVLPTAFQFVVQSITFSHLLYWKMGSSKLRIARLRVDQSNPFFREPRMRWSIYPLSKFGVVWTTRTPSNRVEQIDIIWDYMASPWVKVKDKWLKPSAKRAH